ncbi:unnamed protein product, partial [Meganyctiphanes norvegica]
MSQSRKYFEILLRNTHLILMVFFYKMLLLSYHYVICVTKGYQTSPHLLTDHQLLNATQKSQWWSCALFRICPNLLLHIYWFSESNRLHSVFQKVEVMIVLLGIEKVEGVTLSGGIVVSIGNLLAYKRTFSIEHDYLMLFTNEQFEGGLRSIPFAEGICHPEKSTGVVKASIPASVALTAWIVANQLAISLGMGNDTDSCVCQEQHCIMQEVPKHSPSFEERKLGWSDCSKQWMMQHFDDGNTFPCLKDVPEKVLSSCGNGILEKEELCDCGPESFCNNTCFIATVCQLADHAHCASGACCDIEKCQVKRMSTICRAIMNKCDLPEFCSGHNETCPPDVHKADGFNCHGQDKCYRGQCGAYNKLELCQKTWGLSYKVAHEDCFRGAECGVLQCVDGNRNDCTMTYIANKEEELQRAPDGANCKKGKMCIKTECSAIPAIKFPRNCSGNGLCNNVGQCYCEEGYALPDCAYKKPSTSMIVGLTFPIICIVVLIAVLLFCLKKRKDKGEEDELHLRDHPLQLPGPGLGNRHDSENSLYGVARGG